ncbi:MAG: hypothetical protein ACLFM6_05880 [Spirochaetaceae bacterium]
MSADTPMRGRRVPGNLLLFGEYTVLEEGGLGLACAVAPHVELQYIPARHLSVEGRLGRAGMRWRPHERQEGSGVLSGACNYLAGRLTERGVEVEELRGKLIVDSSAFLSPSGTKRGFGSSAAAVVAVCASLCDLAGITDERERFTLALEAHRAGQNGRGSGYDVAASYFGGIGLFRGGQRPEYRRTRLPWLRALSVQETGTPTSTPDAVARYEEWKSTHDSEAREIHRRSNELVSSLVRTNRWERARELALELQELGRRIGERIGVPAGGKGTGTGGGDAATGQPGTVRGRSWQRDRDCRICKAAGAGAELVVCIEGSPEEPGDEIRTSPAGIDEEGCTWL